MKSCSLSQPFAPALIDFSLMFPFSSLPTGFRTDGAIIGCPDPTPFVKSACPLALNKVTISQTSAAFKMAAGPSSPPSLKGINLIIHP